MKSKTNIHGLSGTLSMSHEAKCTDNHTKNMYLTSMNDSLGSYCSGSVKKVGNHKRKACLSSQEDGNGSEQLKCKQKFKSKKERDDKEIDSHSANEKEMFGESDKDATNQDNTPESLRKKRKLKKKKNRANPISEQPHTSVLDYLRKWKSDRSHWKFEKVKQKRLISNMFENDKLPEDYFSIFLEYVEGGSKSVKELVTKLAKEVVDEMEKWESLIDAEKETTPMVNENKYKRARTVLQMLQ